MPEVSRTHHIAKHGTNVNSEKDLSIYKRMVLSKLPPGNLGDLSYLLKDNFEARLMDSLQSAKLLPRKQLMGLQASQRYVVPFTVEEFKEVGVQFNLYPAQFRSHHNGLLLTRDPRSGAAIALVDRRRGEKYLPEEEAIRPPPDIQYIAAQQGHSCDITCGTLVGYRCDEKFLPFANTCKLLKAHFPCEEGCGHETGDEIPCYVAPQTGLITTTMCLVSDIAPKCRAAHPKTRRLCACVPTR